MRKANLWLANSLLFPHKHLPTRIFSIIFIAFSWFKLEEIIRISGKPSKTSSSSKLLTRISSGVTQPRHVDVYKAEHLYPSLRSAPICCFFGTTCLSPSFFFFFSSQYASGLRWLFPFPAYGAEWLWRFTFILNHSLLNGKINANMLIWFTSEWIIDTNE